MVERIEVKPNRCSYLAWCKRSLDHNMKKYLKKCLNGEEKLWKVFWLLNFLGGFIVSLLVTLAVFQFLATPILEITHNNKDLSFLLMHIPSILLGVTGLLFGIWYEIVALISLWKCSWNCKHKIWGYLARCFIFVSLIYGIFESTVEI